MKKILNKSLLVLASFLFALPMHSCKFLNVSDQLANELSMQDVFNNVAYTRRWHRFIYTGIPDISHRTYNNSYAGLTGLSMPWGGLSDEIWAHNNVQFVCRDGYNASNGSFHRWRVYQQIRQAWQFIDNAHEIPQTGQGDYLLQADVDKLKAEAYFFIGYYHWILFELYGPVPIMDRAVGPSDPELSFARASVDECVAFIEKMWTEADKNLNTINQGDNERSIPSKVLTAALRVKLYAYAASPLYNGGFPEAMALQNQDGKKLFPAKDDTKWQKAKAAVEAYLTISAPYHSIYRCGPPENRAVGFDANESLYQLFQQYNPEIIWATTGDSWGATNGEGQIPRITPRGIAFAMTCYGWLQEAVDDFRMANGLKIDDAGSGYDLNTEFERTPMQVKMFNRAAYPNAGTYETFNDDIAKMYQNREPRFYQWVTYQGRRWQIKTNFIVDFRKGGNNDNSSGNHARPGNIVKKFYPENIINEGTPPRSKFIPCIQLRHAEMLLLAAEVLNEATNGADPRIMQFINDVRTRGGLPTLEATYPGKNWNKAAKWQAMAEEKRIEFLDEGQRYFDVRRWMVADQARVSIKAGGKTHQFGQKGQFTIMNMDGRPGSYEDFFQRAQRADAFRQFEKSWYLYPFSFNEVQNARGKLVQNPGW